jgi:LPXTG-motif cell wall-anchored protein
VSTVEPIYTEAASTVVYSPSTTVSTEVTPTVVYSPLTEEPTKVIPTVVRGIENLRKAIISTTVEITYTEEASTAVYSPSTTVSTIASTYTEAALTVVYSSSTTVYTVETTNTKVASAVVYSPSTEDLTMLNQVGSSSSASSRATSHETMNFFVWLGLAAIILALAGLILYRRRSQKSQSEEEKASKIQVEADTFTEFILQKDAP